MAKWHLLVKLRIAFTETESVDFCRMGKAQRAHQCNAALASAIPGNVIYC
jgi:hypothetical protein